MTPFQLYQWATCNIPSVTFQYCTSEEYQSEKAHLELRFQKSRTILGTRSLHTFIPKSNDTLSIKRYSSSTDSKDERVTKQPEDLEIEQVSGYVTCVHESVWWLACVLEKDLENAEFRLTLLHPHGPSRSYKYPTAPDIITLPLSSILTLVEPRTTTGRTYSLYQRDSRAATAKLKTVL